MIPNEFEACSGAPSGGLGGNAPEVKPVFKRFRALRVILGYSQARIARILDVHPVTVSRWERGTVEIPYIAFLAILAICADLSPDT